MRINLILFGFCVIFAQQVLADDKEEALKEIYEAVDMCKEKVKASDAEIELLKQRKEPASHEGKCLHACLMKHFKVMDGNNKFSKSVALDHAKHFMNDDADKMKKAEQIATACENIDVPADECEASDMYIKCFLGESKKLNVENLFA
uniref:Pheromone binding protein-related protein 5 n=1 Tax=Liriomyza sativae TaxID=127406 RepID=A0A0X8B1P8_LIRSA|nr:pheromone binding protein-related protein 5 [Liriomyza sativae]